MIMNDPDFSILYVDERFKVSKQHKVGCMYILLQLKLDIVAFSLLNQVIFNRE